MPALAVGPLRLGQRAVLRLATALSVVAVAGGMWLGAATAESPGPPLGVLPGTAVATPGGAPAPSPAGDATPAGGATSPSPAGAGQGGQSAGAVPSPAGGAGARPARALRRPLHQLVAAWLQGKPPGQAPAQARLVTGRYLRPSADGAVVAVGRGQTVDVRFTAQTRFPVRQPRPGDPVLVMGRHLPDGTFEARAVAVRRTGTPARPAQR
jgi:hypothetical protein